MRSYFIAKVYCKWQLLATVAFVDLLLWCTACGQSHWFQHSLLIYPDAIKTYCDSLQSKGHVCLLLILNDTGLFIGLCLSPVEQERGTREYWCSNYCSLGHSMFSYNTLKIMTGLLGNKQNKVSDPSVLSPVVLIAGHAVIFDSYRPHNYASHYIAQSLQVQSPDFFGLSPLYLLAYSLSGPFASGLA